MSLTHFMICMALTYFYCFLLQVHVSLAGANHMRVSWMTSVSSANGAPVVQYGLTPGYYNFTAIGESLAYSYMLYRSGTMNHVVIGPLKPSTTYYYKCGGVGSEYKFTTPPPAGPDVPIKFAIVGELHILILCIGLRYKCSTRINVDCIWCCNML